MNLIWPVLGKWWKIRWTRKNMINWTLNKPFALKGIYQLYLCDYEYGIVELKYSEGTLWEVSESKQKLLMHFYSDTCMSLKLLSYRKSFLFYLLFSAGCAFCYWRGIFLIDCCYMAMFCDTWSFIKFMKSMMKLEMYKLWEFFFCFCSFFFTA